MIEITEDRARYVGATVTEGSSISQVRVGFYKLHGKVFADDQILKFCDASTVTNLRAPVAVTVVGEEGRVEKNLYELSEDTTDRHVTAVRKLTNECIRTTCVRDLASHLRKATVNNYSLRVVDGTIVIPPEYSTDDRLVALYHINELVQISVGTESAAKGACTFQYDTGSNPSERWRTAHSGMAALCLDLLDRLEKKIPFPSATGRAANTLVLAKIYRTYLGLANLPISLLPKKLADAPTKNWDTHIVLGMPQTTTQSAEYLAAKAFESAAKVLGSRLLGVPECVPKQFRDFSTPERIAFGTHTVKVKSGRKTVSQTRINRPLNTNCSKFIYSDERSELRMLMPNLSQLRLKYESGDITYDETKSLLKDTSEVYRSVQSQIRSITSARVTHLRRVAGGRIEDTEFAKTRPASVEGVVAYIAEAAEDALRGLLARHEHASLLGLSMLIDKCIELRTVRQD